MSGGPDARRAELDRLIAAATRPGAGRAERDAHRLILDAATDPRRDLAPEELAGVLRHVARAGFDPHALERARGNLVGAPRPDGGRVRTGDRLPPAEIHYLRHVVIQDEWPAGATLAGYVASIRAVIADPASGVLVSRFQGVWQLTVVRESRELRGPRGRDWVMVDYRLRTGHWTTAYQLRGGLPQLEQSEREDRRWLRAPAGA